MSMDSDDPDQKSTKSNSPSSVESQEVDDLQVEVGEDSELNTLLPPGKDGMSRTIEKSRRSVQWNDKNGNKLVEVLEFQPSDVSDSDDEDSDSCICSIM